MGTGDTDFTLFALRLFRMMGKADRYCNSKHSIKCFLISGCLKINAPGGSPFANAVANATAKMPQSVEPLCI